MRESKIEKHLRLSVLKARGMSYKFSSPGRPNVPDRIVIWPRVCGAARIDFVELKAPGKKPNDGQAREHVRLQNLGARVLVLDTIEKVDNYVMGNRTV